MKIGFLFPGQGSQSIGMGKDIYEKYDEAKQVYDKAQQITGIDIAKMSFEGEEDELNQTKNTQLAILTMSLAILAVLNKNNIKPHCAAGLSLGEYSALICSGALTFEQGVEIVKKRGIFMQELAPEGEWAMAAVLGMEDIKVEETCKKITDGFVVPVNYNCPGQIVISGEKQAVEQAEGMLKDAGAKKVRALKVAGPFHTEKLLESSKALEKALENVEIYKFNIPVIKNIDGMEYNDNDDTKLVLTKHIVNPVKFTKTLQTMLDMGVDTFIEVGPGKTLSGFVKRMETDKQINVLSVNNVETLENLITFISNN